MSLLHFEINVLIGPNAQVSKCSAVLIPKSQFFFCILLLATYGAAFVYTIDSHSCPPSYFVAILQHRPQHSPLHPSRKQARSQPHFKSTSTLLTNCGLVTWSKHFCQVQEQHSWSSIASTSNVVWRLVRITLLCSRTCLTYEVFSDVTITVRTNYNIENPRASCSWLQSSVLNSLPFHTFCTRLDVVHHMHLSLCASC